MSLFCPHAWTEYHATEVYMFKKDMTCHVLRTFEVCQVCKKTRAWEESLLGENERKDDAHDCG